MLDGVYKYDVVLKSGRELFVYEPDMREAEITAAIEANKIGDFVRTVEYSIDNDED